MWGVASLHQFNIYQKNVPSKASSVSESGSVSSVRTDDKCDSTLSIPIPTPMVSEQISDNPYNHFNEYNNAQDLTDLITRLADDLCWAVEKDHDRPATFLGVGGRKVFRDLVYKTRFIFMADHRYYKDNDHYDFPQKDIKFRVINTIFPPLMKIPPIRKKMQQNMNKFMIKPFELYREK